MIALLIAELQRQDEKWGEQNHPLIGGGAIFTDAIRGFYADLEADWKGANDVRVDEGTLGWDGILLEEVHEALAATETADQITELVQVAAVAIQAAMALERAA